MSFAVLKNIVMCLAGLLVIFVGTAGADDFKLELPIACEPGQTCWVQQYPDHDAGQGYADYTCGSESYDGHDGTDFRILSLSEKVDVVASAAGTVRGMRNEVTDRLMRTEKDRATVADIECGNGVVLVHPGGWETQYCHMRQGSVVVKAGEAVAAGQKLGEVGSSGAAAFPHVHLSVRKDGRKIDPFSGDLSGACGGALQSLWSGKAQASLSYVDRSVLSLGFLPGAVDEDDFDRGLVRAQTPSARWTAMVAFFRAIHLRKGDDMKITLDGPDGIHAENPQTIDRDKAQYFMFAGKKQPGSGWPKGRYVARLLISNGGAVVLDRSVEAMVE